MFELVPPVAPLPPVPAVPAFDPPVPLSPPGSDAAHAAKATAARQGMKKRTDLRYRRGGVIVTIDSRLSKNGFAMGSLSCRSQARPFDLSAQTGSAASAM
jgi:hypothetical protein